ncbi:uncharacterized protein [Sinocyclocheilus grahami]|uniref:uncharacterized protein n=1 Tax=Sinocyclocheilus grahami TaxID=75366 RepID=UPI0007AD4729|nr:PREDICTED: uncharacterized protein LOC107564504 [Sinocyclocheilus grahami]
MIASCITQDLSGSLPKCGAIIGSSVALKPFVGTSMGVQSVSTDTLAYKHRPVVYETPTLRNIYKVLATQYDPLGLLLPYTTRAKVIIRQLWNKQRGWDDPNLPPELLQSWRVWENELQYLPSITLPRTYVPPEVEKDGAIHEVHIFSDASEQAYGAVAYMRTTDKGGQVYLSFMVARSRVAPKRSHSIPRLELCGALVAAQLARLLQRELTLQIETTVLWTDSSTVLTWLTSESCHYKVFVGNRVAEIQELTEKCSWRYVASASNPADDLTRGKPLNVLTGTNRWSQGPPFLLQDSATWPVMPRTDLTDDPTEIRKSAFCGATAVPPQSIIFDSRNHETWQELLYITAKRVQQESFPNDYQHLEKGKPVSSDKHHMTQSLSAPVIVHYVYYIYSSVDEQRELTARLSSYKKKI